MFHPTRTRFARTAAVALVAASSIGATTAATSSAATAPSTTKTRAQVPWASVGTGWIAADVMRGKTNHLVLAAPSGQTYEIAFLGRNEHVTAISHDGKHVATNQWHSGDGFTHPRVWDVRTGKASNLPINMTHLTFTRPNGSAVMGFNEVNSYGRYSTTGAQQRVVPSSRSSVGDWPTIVPNPDGLTDVVTSSHGYHDDVTLYSHATFTKVRTFAQPTGSNGCRALGWKNPTTLIENCAVKGSNGIVMQQVFAQNIRGGKPTALTSGTYPGGDAYTGFSDVAHTSIGALAITAQGAAGGRDGTVFRLSGTKATSQVDPASINPNGGDYAGGSADKIVGDKIVYSSTPLGAEYTTQRMVAEYDVRTKKLTYLVGNNSHYTGSVGGYAVIDPRA